MFVDVGSGPGLARECAISTRTSTRARRGRGVRGGQAARGRGARGSVVADAEADQGPAAILNAGYNCKLYEAYQLILEHEVFSGIVSEIGHSESQSDFDEAAFLAGMHGPGNYRFGGNAFMAKVCGADDAPSSEKRTMQWLHTHYKDAPQSGQLPSSMIFTSVLGFVEGVVSPVDPAARGKFKMISPSEPLDALVFRIARGIREGESVETLGLWKRCVLSCSMEFVKCESGEAL